MKDVIIVGGGLAGLASAWRLRYHDILLLESEHRVGGRIRSERRGNYWLNWGGHVFPGPDSASGELMKSVGIDALPVPGIVTGMAMNGKLLLDGPVELYPFRMPMPWSARFALMRAGAKVRLAVKEYGKIVTRRPGEDYRTQQQRIYSFMNDCTFSEFVGQLPVDADAIFRPTVSRSTGNPEQVTAGAGVGYFHLIWNKGEGLSRNIVGGASTLTDTIATALGERVQLGAVVNEVIQKKDSVVVRYTQNGVIHEEQARYAVLATPAPITRKIATNIDPELGAALDKIEYGPHVSAAFLTNETGPQVWDNVYAIAAPKKSFDILLHHTNLVRAYEGDRQPGSSLMTFSPAEKGRKLIDKTDEEIIEKYLEDLEDIFPGFRSHVVESHVFRCPFGSAYVFPGRHKLQSTLTRPTGRLFLAGDYLGTFYAETAVQTGFTAAQNINGLLGTEFLEVKSKKL